MIELNEAIDILSGIDLYGKKGLPFIVRNTSDIIINYNKIKEASDINIYTTDIDTMEYVEDVNLLSALNDWENNTLKYNYTDSKIDTIEYGNVNIETLKKYGVGLTMCLDGTYTPFHIDSTDIKMGGGGWVYLQTGKKIWYLMDFFSAVNNIYSEDKKCLVDINQDINQDIHQDINQDKKYKIYHGEIKSGDFIYFPPGWAHQVTTLEKSIGLNGYLLLEEDMTNIELINKWYEITSNNYTCGLLHRTLTDKDIHKMTNIIKN